MFKAPQKILKTRKHWLIRRWYLYLPLISIILLIWGNKAVGQDLVTTNTIEFYLNTIWLLIAASLVFFMNAGFAMLETGLCRTSNATNVLAKNLIVFCVSALAFWLFGFGLMFGDGLGNTCPTSDLSPSFIGQQGFIFQIFFPQSLSDTAFPSEGFTCLGESWQNRSFSALFFFQLTFAGTAATIVSGAVAERIRFYAFILFSFFLVGFSYPLIGHWVWGHNGLLAEALKFQDFAGSTVVHSVGGTAGLVGALLLKPRNGRFGYDVETQEFEKDKQEVFRCNSLSLATLGCIILWLGWFGFNGGSTTNLAYVPHIITTTMIAAAMGGVSATISSSVIIRKPSLASIINGILGGLVSITASSAYVDIGASFLIGTIGGVVVLFGEYILEKCQIDDPVGAIPVHLFCGGWGTIAYGIFSSDIALKYLEIDFHENRGLRIVAQVLGWLIVVAVTFVLSWILWTIGGLLINLFSPQINDHNNSKTYENLGDFITNQYQLAIKSIRVTIPEEKQGCDGIFSNIESELDKRIEELENRNRIRRRR